MKEAFAFDTSVVTDRVEIKNLPLVQYVRLFVDLADQNNFYYLINVKVDFRSK